MGMPWTGVPGHWPRRSLSDPAASHWFMEELPSPGDAGHPAQRGTGLVQHAYNPGVAAWRGRTVLACRVGSGPVSGIWIGYLRQDLSPRRDRFVEVLPYHEGESFEDPRLFVHRGRLFLTCAVVRHSHTAQCIVEIGKDLRARWFREFKSPEGRSVEKNWVFFSHGKDMYCVYHAGRGMHEVHEFGSGEMVPRWSTPNAMEWHWGEIRGGSSPVPADGQYWTFFHSRCLQKRALRYFMGAYAFEACPPFRVTAYTPMPLYTPPEPSRCFGPRDVKHVIFPGGLLRVGGEWLVFSGYNDERIVVSRISHARLAGLMVKLPGR
jgi:predicted GH43/DUF377 family glycosyl hydrolase